jgi:Fe2+ or Zn2+ uptake regulation protein
MSDILEAVKTPDQLTELFRSTGRKVTAQRQCIFRVLQGDDTHPSAETVHAAASREMETISLKTVYQTLHDLADLGEIVSLDVGTGTTRFDPNVDHPHHHLVCRECGRVRDLVAAFPELTIPDGADLGFEVGTAEIVFRGLCPDCRAPAGNAGAEATRRARGSPGHTAKKGRAAALAE